MYIKRHMESALGKVAGMYPAEIKKTGGGLKKDIAAFELLKKGSLEVGEGGLICIDETKAFLTSKDRIIPVNML